MDRTTSILCVTKPLCIFIQSMIFVQKEETIIGQFVSFLVTYICLLEITFLLFKPLFVYSYATGTSWVSQHENVCDICNSDNLEYQFKC